MGACNAAFGSSFLSEIGAGGNGQTSCICVSKSDKAASNRSSSNAKESLLPVSSRTLFLRSSARQRVAAETISLALRSSSAAHLDAICL
eukprot:794954-Amphidinium_carterae.1